MKNAFFFLICLRTQEPVLIPSKARSLNSPPQQYTHTAQLKHVNVHILKPLFTLFQGRQIDLDFL